MINLYYLKNMIKMRGINVLKSTSHNIRVKLKSDGFIFATSAVSFAAGFSFPEYGEIE